MIRVGKMVNTAEDYKDAELGTSHRRVIFEICNRMIKSLGEEAPSDSRTVLSSGIF